MKEILKKLVGWKVDFTELRMSSMIIAFENSEGHKCAISFQGCTYFHDSGLIGDKFSGFAFPELPGTYLFNILNTHFKVKPEEYFELRIWTENTQNLQIPSSNKIILVAKGYKFFENFDELVLRI